MKRIKIILEVFGKVRTLVFTWVTFASIIYLITKDSLFLWSSFYIFLIGIYNELCQVNDKLDKKNNNPMTSEKIIVNLNGEVILESNPKVK